MISLAYGCLVFSVSDKQLIISLVKHAGSQSQLMHITIHMFAQEHSVVINIANNYISMIYLTNCVSPIHS